MSSHSHITANVEIRSISDDDESSVCSFPSTTRQDALETLHDDELLECDDQVTTEEMIAEAIRGGPNVNDVSMDGCTNITIGNQTHIKGTVIIRNVLTRSVAEPDIRPCIHNCVNRKEPQNELTGSPDSIRQSSSSEVSSKMEEDYEYRKFRKSDKNRNSNSEKSCCVLFQQLYNTRKRKFIILSILIVILLIVSGIFAAILLYSCMFCLHILIPD